MGQKRKIGRQFCVEKDIGSFFHMTGESSEARNTVDVDKLNFFLLVAKLASTPSSEA